MGPEKKILPVKKIFFFYKSRGFLSLQSSFQTENLISHTSICCGKKTHMHVGLLAFFCLLVAQSQAEESGGGICVRNGTQDQDLCFGNGVCAGNSTLGTCVCVPQAAGTYCEHSRKQKLIAFLLSFFVGELGAGRYGHTPPLLFSPFLLPYDKGELAHSLEWTSKECFSQNDRPPFGLYPIESHTDLFHPNSFYLGFTELATVKLLLNVLPCLVFILLRITRSIIKWRAGYVALNGDDATLVFDEKCTIPFYCRVFGYIIIVLYIGGLLLWW